MITAIILAAGASQRMGYPKALLRFHGTTFLETILQAALAAGVGARVVVLGPDMRKVLSECSLEGIDAQVVENTNPETGPIRSLQLGVAEVINRPVEAVLVWHVDRPHVAVSTIQALVNRFRDGGAAIVVPSYDGRRGHPVIFGRAVFEELLAVPMNEGARTVVRADPSRVVEVPVDDPAVVEDVDTPDDYHDLLRRADGAGATPPPGPTP